VTIANEIGSMMHYELLVVFGSAAERSSRTAMLWDLSARRQ
jgi:hypothetical protein